METKPFYKSKTICAGIITLIIAMFNLFGGQETPLTIDDLAKPVDHTNQLLISLGLLGTGAMGIKGRYDANTQIKRKGEQ